MISLGHFYGTPLVKHTKMKKRLRPSERFKRFVSSGCCDGGSLFQNLSIARCSIRQHWSLWIDSNQKFILYNCKILVDNGDAWVNCFRRARWKQVGFFYFIGRNLWKFNVESNVCMKARGSRKNKNHIAVLCTNDRNWTYIKIHDIIRPEANA